LASNLGVINLLSSKSNVKHMVGVETMCGLYFVGYVYAVLTTGRGAVCLRMSDGLGGIHATGGRTQQ
jgi:hypothetical protein